MKYRPRHMIEYGFMRLIGGVLCILPYRGALSIGWILAKLGALAMPGKMRTAEKRIRQALGPERSDKDIRRIAWESWRNLCFSAIEVLRAPRHSTAFVQKVTDCTEFSKLKKYLDADERVILAVPHMGSWELAGVSASSMGAPLLFIVREQKNPLANEYLNRMRSGQGQTFVDRDDPNLVRKILRMIKQKRVLTILPDIRARTDALHVTFLNGNATVAAGMGLFARQTKTPILPSCVIREGWAKHRWLGFDVIEPDPSLDKAEDFQRMTQAVLNVFSDVIREHPEQYFWFNKKWILDE